VRGGIGRAQTKSTGAVEEAKGSGSAKMDDIWLKLQDIRPRLGEDEDGADDDGGQGGGRPGTGVATQVKPRTKKPSMYKVLMLNDDYTPMEFVVYVLERFFQKSREDATRVMLHVHQRGVGICGVYSYEVAETKVTQVMDFARQNQHPLQCTLEKD
jgi:ATP-dependent Clp protease adaptor protein ClpS